MAGGLTYHFSAFKTSFDRAERESAKAEAVAAYLQASCLGTGQTNSNPHEIRKEGDSKDPAGHLVGFVL